MDTNNHEWIPLDVDQALLPVIRVSWCAFVVGF
jgi:hypothetical protein